MAEHTNSRIEEPNADITTIDDPGARFAALAEPEHVPIEKINGLVPRAVDGLRKAGIEALDDLTGLTAEYVGNLDDVGPGSLRVLDRAMDDHGLSFAPPAVTKTADAMQVEPSSLGASELIATDERPECPLPVLLARSAPEPHPDPARRGDLDRMAREITEFEAGALTAVYYRVGRYVVGEFFDFDIEEAQKRGPKRTSIAVLNERLGRSRTDRRLYDQVGVYCLFERHGVDLAPGQDLEHSLVLAAGRHPSERAQQRWIKKALAGETSKREIEDAVKKAKATNGVGTTPSVTRRVSGLAASVTDLIAAVQQHGLDGLDPEHVGELRVRPGGSSWATCPNGRLRLLTQQQRGPDVAEIPEGAARGRDTVTKLESLLVRST